MQIQIYSALFDFYFCNGHYDISNDEMARNGFNFRVRNILYSKEKGFRKFNSKLLWSNRN